VAEARIARVDPVGVYGSRFSGHEARRFGATSFSRSWLRRSSPIATSDRRDAPWMQPREELVVARQRC